MIDLRSLTKEERITLAKENYRIMSDEKRNHIRYGIDNTTEYCLNVTDIDDADRVYNTNIILNNNDSVTQLFAIERESGDNIAVLNFASFKHPGGQYLSGSPAQEESLCHHSNLYNVLEQFEDSYYRTNRGQLNKALYQDVLLYTEDILFRNYLDTNHDYREERLADVITCAAPNYGTYMRYFGNKSSQVDIYEVLKNRIDLVLQSAYFNKANVLILGAFGCGVFKNSPNQVANVFMDLLNDKYRGIFKDVYFPIPKGKDGNYDEFERVFYERSV